MAAAGQQSIVRSADFFEKPCNSLGLTPPLPSISLLWREKREAPITQDRRHRIIAWLIFGWSLVGIAAWGFDVLATPEQLAQGDPATAQIWQMMPVWAWAAYALAVWSSLAGALALLRGRRIAIALFALCAISIAVQFGWSFLGSPLLALKGWSAAVFPVILLLVALAETFYARARFKA
jgi:cation transport ATPase